MTYEKLKELYPDKSKYRVSRKKRTTGASYPVTTAEGLCYIISGSCNFEYDDFIIEGKALEKFMIPTGTYIFKPNPKEGVELVMVWNIHELMEKKKKAT